MLFGDVASEARGTATTWDDDVLRTELAVGYRLSREVLLKADWQRHMFADGGPSSSNLFALQLSTAF